MKDNYYYHFAMHAYLERADRHYLEGRSLWTNLAVDGACNLLWLAIEQMIKLIIIQERVANGSLGSVVIKDDQGKKVSLSYSSQEKDVRKIHVILDKTSYSINSQHQLGKLLTILQKETGIDLSSYQGTLEKVKDYYERRYYKDEGSSIKLTEIDNIDKIYFELRNKIVEEIPRSLIDEIGYQHKFGTGHPLQYFEQAYINNKSFKTRKHPVVYQLLPNDKIIKNDGLTDEFTDSAPPMIPLHVAVKKLNY